MKQDEIIKDIKYWKSNAEEDYMKVPISVLRYITELENLLSKQPSGVSEEELVEKHYNLMYKRYGNFLDAKRINKISYLKSVEHAKISLSIRHHKSVDKRINKVDFLEEIITIMKNSYGIKYFSESKFIEGLKELLRSDKLKSLSPQSDAVEFAEWIEENGWVKVYSGIKSAWINSQKYEIYAYASMQYNLELITDCEPKTTQELFTQYLKEKRTPPQTTGNK